MPVGHFSESMRDVRIRLNAEMGSMDGFSKFQRQSTQLAGHLEKMVTTLRTIGGEAEKQADKATRAWDRFDKAVKKSMTTQTLMERRLGGMGAFGSVTATMGGSGIGGLAGMIPAGAMRFLAPAAIASGGMSILGDIFSSAHASAAGTPLQRSDLGMVSRFFQNIQDTMTGRDIRQRALDQRMEAAESRAGIESSYRAGRYARRFAMEDVRGQLNVMHPDIVGIRPQEQMAILDRMMAPLTREASDMRIRQEIASARARDLQGRPPALPEARNIPPDMLRYYQQTGAIPRDVDIGTRGASPELIQKAFNEAKQAGEDEAALYKRHNDLLREKLGLAKSISQAQVGRIAGLREGFAGLDPLQRDRAKALGMKIRAGGLLEQGEYEEAMSLPGVRDLLTRRQIDIDERTGSFNAFLGATGRPEDLTALAKTPPGTRVEVVITLNEQATEEMIKRIMENLKARVDALAIRQARDADARNQFDQQQRINRDAVHGGPP